MKRIIIYGIGAFYAKNEDTIEHEFKVVGYIDRERGGTVYNNKCVRTSIDKCTEEYDSIFIMVENVDFIFEIIEELRCNRVEENKIIVGKIYYDYNEFIMSHAICAGKLQVCVGGKVCVISSKEEYYQVIKKEGIAILREKGISAERQLEKIYGKLLELEWLGDDPLSHNHNIDIFYRFPRLGIFDWGENASFNLRAIYQFDKPIVLDLGCADGFYFNRFYSFVDGIQYLGCDMDGESIELAKDNNYGEGTKFIKCDFLENMPFIPEWGAFSNVLWNDSIQMFDTQEREVIFTKIKQRLTKDGILSGTATILEHNIVGGWKYAKYPFDSKEQVVELLLKYFKNVFVYKDKGIRNRVLFMASDGDLPFIASC